MRAMQSYQAYKLLPDCYNNQMSHNNKETTNILSVIQVNLFCPLSNYKNVLIMIGQEILTHML